MFSNLVPGYEGVGEFYDLFADNTDIPFYIKIAGRTGSPILDLAAGTGRIAIALAREGYEVTALDNSPSMLATATKKLRQVPDDVSRRITLIEGNMEQFRIPRKFALIIIPNSFGHVLTANAQLATLRCIRSHMKDDSIFVLDLYVGEQQYTHASFTDSPVHIGNNRTIERHGEINSDINRKLMRIDISYVIKSIDGAILETVEVVSGVALFYDKEVDTLLKKSGFEIIEEIGSFQGDSYSTESGRRILILRKSKNELKMGD
jgi:SAM-dependent methyltransferase